MIKNRILLFGLVAFGMLIVLAISVLVGLNAISDKRTQIFKFEADNMVWSVGQLQRETMVTLLALKEQTRGSTNFAQRFDILWSRLALLEQGEVGREVGDLAGGPATVVLVRGVLDLIDGDLPAIKEGDRQAIERAEESLSALLPALQALSVEAVAYQHRLIDELQSNIEELVWYLGFSFFGVMISGIALAGYIYWQLFARLKDLRWQEAFRRSVAETAFDSVITVDESGQIIDFNPAAEKTLLFKSDQILGRSLAETIIPERHRAAHEKGMARYLRTGVTKVLGKRIEIEAVRADGKEIPVELSVSGIKVDRRQYFTAYLRDISKRVERDNELLAAKEAAEEGSRVKSKFLAMMSHEIRTPLNGVLGAIGLLDMKKMSPADRSYVGLARESAKNLLALINTILDFSKLEAGKLDLETSCFDTSQIVETVVQLLSSQAEEKGILLWSELSPELPQLLVGDQIRIQQVLSNLASNAVKFTYHGGVTIRLGLVASDDKTARIRFEIEDTGVGIDVDDQEKLFEEFWAKPQSKASTMGSSGLGLAISQHLVHMMSGQIGFESSPGEGSLFWFEVPLRLPAVDQLPRGVVDGGAPVTGARNRRQVSFSGRVLVAEDNPTNQLIVRAMLDRLGLQVEMVGDGQEAINAVRSRPFDVIFMDIAMPEMDGMEATAAIRALPGPEAKTPIIAMTAYVMRGDRERILSHGLDDFVGKPLSRADLIETLSRWLDPGTAVRVPDGTGCRAEQKPVFEPAALDELTANVGRDRVVTILNTYLTELEGRTAAINQAFQDSDLERIAKEAHPLKSSSAGVGALRMGEFAAHVEAAAREGDCASLDRMVAKAPVFVLETRTKVETVMRDLKNG